MADWNTFPPLDAHLVSGYPGRLSPWRRFRQLAQRVTTDLRGPELLGENDGPPRPRR